MKKFTSEEIINKRLVLTIFAIFTLLYSYGQKTSTGSGAWNNAATWTPAGVPGNNDDVTILAGHTVTVPVNAFCKRLFISGTLNMTGAGITMDISNNSMASPTNGLQLNAGGTLNIGSTNILYFSNTQASGIVNNGGTIVSTGTNGIDGGTIRTNTCCGGEFRVSGTASTTVYNLDFLQNANFNIQSGGLFVNGTLSLDDNNWNSSGSTLSPIYGPASTLYINWNGQGITSSAPSPLNNNLSKLWNATSGTIGVTAGYPNNVTLVNMGTSNGSVNVPPNINVGWAPTGTVGLNGALRLGDGTLNGVASLHSVTTFNSGGIIVDNNSTLVSPAAGATYINRGNFTLQGATTGLYYNYGAIINFAGSGTVGSPQIISTTDGAGLLTFSNMTVSNGTYVRIDDDVNITYTINLASGYVGTSAANSLTITNTANTAVIGGGSTAYIDGPLNWAFPSAPSGNYMFPVGDYSGGTYLPLTLSGANSSGGTTVTVEAFQANPGGSKDATINTMSTTEYWSIATTNPFSGGAQVTAQRPTAVAPYNSLASSSASNGLYTAIGGTPNAGTPGIISGGGIGSTSPVFVRMVNAFLNVVRIGGTNASVDASCNPTATGSLIVGGVGGTPPYQYSLNGGAYQVSNTFSPLAKGTYNVTVRDATMATKTSILKVLGPLQINGNDQDVDICVGQSTTLSATNLLNTSAAYTWSPGGQTTPGITVSPATATTYTVSSTIYANNLLANGSFEGGATPTGFSNAGAYQPHAGGYGTTPGAGGWYKIATAGNSLCTFFTTLAAQDGSSYYIADGNTAAMDVFSLNLTGLTVGVSYRFSYWYAKGSPTAPDTPLETRLNGAAIGSVTVSNYTGWTQAVYNFTAAAATATMTIRNTLAPGNTDGNDFYIDNVQLMPPCTVSASVTVTVNCTLPVVYTYFNAERQGAGALLTWETATEINSSYFIVEKSLDGITFTSIGKVNAAGNSSEPLKYSLTDPYITTGVTYYRLAQYDLNCAVHYSVIRAVTKDGPATIHVSPNPNSGIFVVMSDNTNDIQSRIRVVNSIGQMIYEDGEFTSGLINVDISHFASGVYYIQVITEEGTIVQKVIKE
ncbi:MAG: T9SS type A sorting domain-containing protein [Cytophagaceae bacterium]|nr:T9SS type A sorting domain-containing protein [Cytophagaceae bacterium]